MATTKKTSTKKTSKSKKEPKQEAPFYLKMLDQYIEQVDKATPEILGVVKDVQDLCTKEMKIVLNAGQKLTKQTKNSSELASKTEKFCEDAASVVIKMQDTCVNASLKANKEIAKTIRNNLGKQTSKKTK